MGAQEDYIETVVTCEGDFYDPEFQEQLNDLKHRLQDLIGTGSRKLIVKKVEPWNSVRVTFNIPKEAAVRLKQLAEQGDQALRQLGVLSVQVEGDRSISLTIAGKNNEPTEIVFRTNPAAAAGSGVAGPPTAAAGSNTSVFEGSDDMNYAGPKNVETTRRNIAQYLSQQEGNAFLDSILSPSRTGKVRGAAALHNEALTVAGGHPSSLNSPSRSPGHSSSNNSNAGMGVLQPSPHLQHHQVPYMPGRSPPSYPVSSASAAASVGMMGPHHPHPPHLLQAQSMHPAGPLSPKYPTPPPSVSNPASPGLRTATSYAASGNFAHGNPTINNLPRMAANKDITSSSPLLVNLLQSDAGGHLNNLIAQQKGFPQGPFDSFAPVAPKKKRRPRKDKTGESRVNKAGNKGIVAGPSEGNGAMMPGMPPHGPQLPQTASAALTAVAAAAQDRVPPVTGPHQDWMVELQPHTTHASPHLPQPPPQGFPLPLPDASPILPPVKSPVRGKSPAGPLQHQQQIINPYTGQLETVTGNGPLEQCEDSTDHMRPPNLKPNFQHPTIPLTALHNRMIPGDHREISKDSAGGTVGYNAVCSEGGVTEPTPVTSIPSGQWSSTPLTAASSAPLARVSATALSSLPGTSSTSSLPAHASTTSSNTTVVPSFPEAVMRSTPSVSSVTPPLPVASSTSAVCSTSVAVPSSSGFSAGSTVVVSSPLPPPPGPVLHASSTSTTPSSMAQLGQSLQTTTTTSKTPSSLALLGQMTQLLPVVTSMTMPVVTVASSMAVTQTVSSVQTVCSTSTSTLHPAVTSSCDHVHTATAALSEQAASSHTGVVPATTGDTITSEGNHRGSMVTTTKTMWDQSHTGAVDSTSDGGLRVQCSTDLRTKELPAEDKNNVYEEDKEGSPVASPPVTQHNHVDAASSPPKHLDDAKCPVLPVSGETRLDSGCLTTDGSEGSIIRSNGASTSEESPGSGSDSGIASQAATRTDALGHLNHDSELSSHSFDEHGSTISQTTGSPDILPNRSSTDQREVSPVDSEPQHKMVAKKGGDKGPAKPQAPTQDNKVQIVVGYALASEHSMVGPKLLKTSEVQYVSEQAPSMSKCMVSLPDTAGGVIVPNSTAVAAVGTKSFTTVNGDLHHHLDISSTDMHVATAQPVKLRILEDTSVLKGSELSYDANLNPLANLTAPKAANKDPDTGHLEDNNADCDSDWALKRPLGRLAQESVHTKLHHHIREPTMASNCLHGGGVESKFVDQGETSSSHRETEQQVPPVDTSVAPMITPPVVASAPVVDTKPPAQDFGSEPAVETEIKMVSENTGQVDVSMPEMLGPAAISVDKNTAAMHNGVSQTNTGIFETEQTKTVALATTAADDAFEKTVSKDEICAENQSEPVSMTTPTVERRLDGTTADTVGNTETSSDQQVTYSKATDTVTMDMNNTDHVAHESADKRKVFPEVTSMETSASVLEDTVPSSDENDLNKTSVIEAKPTDNTALDSKIAEPSKEVVKLPTFADEIVTEPNATDKVVTEAAEKDKPTAKDEIVTATTDRVLDAPGALDKPVSQSADQENTVTDQTTTEQVVLETASTDKGVAESGPSSKGLDVTDDTNVHSKQSPVTGNNMKDVTTTDSKGIFETTKEESGSQQAPLNGNGSAAAEDTAVSTVENPCENSRLSPSDAAPSGSLASPDTTATDTCEAASTAQKNSGLEESDSKAMDSSTVSTSAQTPPPPAQSSTTLLPTVAVTTTMVMATTISSTLADIPHTTTVSVRQVPHDSLTTAALSTKAPVMTVTATSTPTTALSGSLLPPPIPSGMSFILPQVATTDVPVVSAVPFASAAGLVFQGSSLVPQVVHSKAVPTQTSAGFTDGQFSHVLSSMAQMHRSSGLETAFGAMAPLQLATLMNAGLPAHPYPDFTNWSSEHLKHQLSDAATQSAQHCPSKTTTTAKAPAGKVNKMPSPNPLVSEGSKVSPRAIATTESSAPVQNKPVSSSSPLNKTPDERTTPNHDTKSVENDVSPGKTATSSKGISILKPLQDRELEVEDVEMVTTPDMKKVKLLKSVDEHNDVDKAKAHSVANIASTKTSFSVAQFLDETKQNHVVHKTSDLHKSQGSDLHSAQHKSQAPDLHKSHATDLQHEYPEANTEESIVAPPMLSVGHSDTMSYVSMPHHTQPRFKVHKNAVKTHSITVTSAIELPNHLSPHISSFVQKSLSTPTVVVNSAHPITSPGFCHNLTESVQKVMRSLPLDVTPPTSPNYNKLVPGLSSISATALNLVASPKMKQKQVSPPVSQRKEIGAVKSEVDSGVTSCLMVSTAPENPPIKQEHPSPSSSDSSFVSEHSYSARPPSDISPRKLSPAAASQQSPRSRLLTVVKTEPSDTHSYHQSTIESAVATNTASSEPVPDTKVEVAAVAEEVLMAKSKGCKRKLGVQTEDSVEAETSRAAKVVKRSPSTDSQHSLKDDLPTRSSRRNRKRSNSTESVQSNKDELYRPARVARRKSRESTESQKSTSSKRDESPKVTSTPLRTRSRGTSESSDRRTPTPTPSEYRQSQRTSRGGSSERSVSPVPGAGRMATRSSGRKHPPESQAPESAAGVKTEDMVVKNTRGSKRKLIMTEEVSDNHSRLPAEGLSSDDDIVLSELKGKGTPAKGASSSKQPEEEVGTARVKKAAGSKADGGVKPKPAPSKAASPVEDKTLVATRLKGSSQKGVEAAAGRESTPPAPEESPSEAVLPAAPSTAKRSTRSCKAKEHCELPAQVSSASSSTKRRRTSRDAR